MELLKVILKDLGNIASKTVVSKFVKSVSTASILFSFLFFNPSFSKENVKGPAEGLDKIIS